MNVQNSNLEPLKSIRTKTCELVDSFTDEQMNFVPKAGKWSIGEVVDHLILSEGIYRGEIQTLIGLKRAGKTPAIHRSLREINASIAFIPKSALPFLEIPLSMVTWMVPSMVRDTLIERVIIPSTNPDISTPRTGRSASELKAELRSSVEKTTKLFEDNLDLDFEEMRHTHPLIGANTVPSMIRFISLHESRHHGQIRDVMKVSGFPAGNASPVFDGESAPLSELARLLAADSEVGLRQGKELFNWWREKAGASKLPLFPLEPGYPPYLEWKAFFDTATLDGKETTVVGCMQQNLFKVRGNPNRPADETFESFFDTQFLRQCRWEHRDGLPGGFRYKAIVGKKQGSKELVPLDPSPDGPFLDISELATKWEWLTLQVDILDFVRSNPHLERFNRTLSQYMKESAYISYHRDFSIPATPPGPGVVAERVFGYAFLPREVAHNVFGFGPGHFGAAVKQWRFSLLESGDIRAQIAFIVSPRSEMVMNLGGFDPVYQPVDLMAKMMLGGFGVAEKLHDQMDRTFMHHHARVHSGLVIGMHEIFERQNWIAAREGMRKAS